MECAKLLLQVRGLHFYLSFTRFSPSGRGTSFRFTSSTPTSFGLPRSFKVPPALLLSVGTFRSSTRYIYLTPLLPFPGGVSSTISSFLVRSSIHSFRRVYSTTLRSFLLRLRVRLPIPCVHGASLHEPCHPRHGYPVSDCVTGADQQREPNDVRCLWRSTSCRLITGDWNPTPSFG
jgi:hypothetical protein